MDTGFIGEVKVGKTDGFRILIGNRKILNAGLSLPFRKPPHGRYSIKKRAPQQHMLRGADGLPMKSIPCPYTAGLRTKSG